MTRRTNETEAATVPCLGCDAPLTYTVVTESRSAPEILPPAGAVAYRGGHLCGNCAWEVETLLSRGKPVRS